MNLAAALDEIAETADSGGAARLLGRVAFAFLVLMVLFAPHSIAATQTAWLVGMTAWIFRLFIKPRPAVKLTALGIALIALFIWTVISSLLSYEPAVSLDKLRGASVFLIFIYAFNVIRNRRAAILLAFALIGSTMIAVAWTPLQKLIGRGVEVHGVAADGALGNLGVVDGDTILRVDGRKIGGPEEIVAALQTKPSVQVTLYRPDYEFRVDLARGDLGQSTNAAALGFSSWHRSSKFRSAGFYGHYTTFAEVLQLIGALTFGLLVAAFMAGTSRLYVAGLAVCVAGIAFALLLTVTRASQLAFLISSAAIVLLGASRKIIVAGLAVAVPVSLVGLYMLQQQRQVGFFDAKDGSIQYRQMMWRDGARLLTESPRHLIVGVGMDSLKEHWREWGFYDKGWQPMGHFHSTPVQFAVERGIPALIIWLIVLGICARSLWRGIRSGDAGDWRTRGILLGCFGGLIGFFASGLVHYNLGDQEVAMVFYILMAIGMRIAESRPEEILLADSPILRKVHN